MLYYKKLSMLGLALTLLFLIAILNTISLRVKSIIVTEVTVMSPFIMYSSQNPWNFIDMEVIMIKEDVKCLSPFGRPFGRLRVNILQHCLQKLLKLRYCVKIKILELI